MKIIVGLGNPGDKYKGTRHNIGFMITGELASKNAIDGKFNSKFESILGKGSINGKEVVILQPMTFMNLSGQAVVKALNWYNIEPSELLVVFDDINLDIGRIRFRDSGTDGGHNGIKSIVESLGGFKDFPRLKVGIGPNPGSSLMKSFVLQEFTQSEKEILEKIIPLSVDAIELFLDKGITQARDKFNGINLSKGHL